MKKLFLMALFMLLTFSFASFVAKAEEAQQGNDSTLSVDVVSYFSSTNEVVTPVPNQTYGSKVSMQGNLDSEAGYSFAYWIVNGVVRNDLPIDYTFTITYNLELIGVFYPTDPVQYLVMFMDANGHSIDWEYVSSEGSATAPESLPSKPGYLVDDENPWSVDFTSVTENIVTVLQYELDQTGTYSLLVENGTGDDGAVSYNEVVTVVADTPESGDAFHHWEVEDRIVSYQSTYSFTMLKNTTITAVYVDEAQAPSDLPTISLSNDLALRTGYKTYLGQFYIPSRYEMIEFGVLSSTSSDYLDLDSDGVVRNKGEKHNGSTNEFVISIQEANAVSVRGYMILKDNNLGTLLTVYDKPAYSVYNGGFETGDLSGWNAYTIWKNESGMAAFVDDRVVDGTYFDSKPYDRDGTYNLGIVGGSVTWDQSSERMGHLRSSDFTLGGSGYVSFKLGGGKTPSFAYVSVRKTVDNTEVARFGNRHFNDTTKATAQYGSTIDNAEAFLFQYYFDLSTVGVIGESYYFTITEEASFDWAILSADSFISFYKEAPTTTADTLAVNILPSISGTGSAANSIPNGYFDSDLTNWTNVDSSWYIDSGQARSNPSGDGNLGVLRSSAFNINGTGQYLRFDWAGGLKWDKQIYVSVKEVGTNIEVMRFVRRDNLSSKESTNFDNHMLNLSTLDTSKEYYLEFTDNRSGSWGISFIDAIRLVDESEWNSVTSGDRAVAIHDSYPLETDFVYNFNG
jgi:hypothetical protein